MEAITFELGREGLINFKKQGKKKTEKKVFQEAGNILTEMTGMRVQ